MSSPGGSMTERLQLVVDATTGRAEASFGRLSQAARDTGDAAAGSARTVVAAANRVAEAQARTADAAGQVRVAQQRLQALQDKGNASAGQLAAAEERLASAQRKLHLATRDAAHAQSEQTAVHAQAEVPLERTRRGAGALGEQLGELRGQVVGVVAGLSLADWASDSVRGFAEGARAAGGLATSMNATTEQAGTLYQLLANVGLESGDVLEIQAQFAQVIGANSRALTDMGGSVQRNADGTTNWALTLEDALVQLQAIPDATERNQRGFQLFGEEGYKQLSRLLTSGMDVKDALAAIGTPFTDEDLAATRDYDRAVLQLRMTSGSLGRDLGRVVLPVVTALAGGLHELTEEVTSIPAPLGIATAAAVAMGVTGFNPLVKGAELVSTGVDKMRSAWESATSGVEAGAGRMTRVVGGVRGAASGLMGAVGGPLGVATIAFGALMSVAIAEGQEMADATSDAARQLAAAQQSMGKTGQTADRLGRSLAEDSDWFERSSASAVQMRDSVDDAGGVLGFLDDATGGLGSSLVGLVGGLSGTDTAAAAFTARIEKARKELGEFGGQQAAAEIRTRSLADMIAEGTTSGKDFGIAVRDASVAQAEQERTSGLAAAAIDAYRASTSEASAAVWELINARYASEDANFAFLQAMDEAKGATDDSKTSVDEARQAQVQLMEAALAAASSAADAAVQQAEASGQVVDDTTEASLRAQAMLDDLRARMNTPGLTKGAKDELQGVIDQLTDAQSKGDIQAVLELTGADTTGSKIDEATKDRTSTVTVESRNGPAVKTYLDGLADQRLGLIRVESRNGPAVDAYLDSLRYDDDGGQRLALIRVESRNGPAVDTYLDNLASNFGQGRTAYVDVQERTGGGSGGGGTGLAQLMRGAPQPATGTSYTSGDTIIQQLTVQVAADSSGRLTQQSLAEAGRQYVAAIGAYERRNGPGWRGSGSVRR